MCADKNNGNLGSSDMSPHPRDEVKKPWPLSWILIVILVYIGLQTAYFLFFAN
jgi:hypothetical protein